MKMLTLLRHAKAVPPGPGIEDHERGLAPRGRRAAAAVGRETAARPPALVLCSTALRTRQTLEEAAAAWDRKPRIRYDDALYLAGPERLLERIAGVEDAVSTLWAIGHNPGLHELALLLAGTGDTGVPDLLAERFPTAARAVFRSEVKSWKALRTAPLTLVEFAIIGPAAAD